MKLSDRIRKLTKICCELIATSSLNEKRDIVNNIDEELKDDFQYILEILAGKHKLYYTYTIGQEGELFPGQENMTFREYIAPLFEPFKIANLSDSCILHYKRKCPRFQNFIESIVNRELKLGIGLSVLPKEDTSPMLAKKWDGILGSAGRLYVTEKLDGNRCIAMYDGTKWVYFSRNGKIKNNYNFDMSGLPKEYIYDGEVLTVEQTQDSEQLFKYIKGVGSKPVYRKQFNSASGRMNRKDVQSGLVYNIFDIMYKDTYDQRRIILDGISFTLHSENVRILPLLSITNNTNYIDMLCDEVTSCGAEGLMINRPFASYEHTRTNGLLKYKKSKSMDMKVYNIVEGTGKYEFAVGALDCEAILPNGDKVICQVGTGLKDDQRFYWYEHKKEIIGKIVEVEYFDISQNKLSSGSNIYSLRFPRLKCVRTDKDETSIY